MKKKEGKKIRVNITVDKEMLEKAKEKLEFFGGKLSTLFNTYLHDFVQSIEKDFENHPKSNKEKMKELESRLKKIEKDLKEMDRLEKFYKNYKGI